MLIAAMGVAWLGWHSSNKRKFLNLGKGNEARRWPMGAFDAGVIDGV